MLRFARRRAICPGFVGIALTPESIDVVRLESVGDAAPAVRLAVSVPCAAADAERERALREIIEQHGLQDMPCACVLPSDAHAVRVIDAPAVPEEELVEASRWAVQETVDFPVDDAAVHIASRTPVAGRGSRLVVVVARGAVVRDAAALVRRAGLQPRAVCVPESSLAALAPASDDPKGSALLRLDTKQGLLVIGRGGRLCVARTVPSNLDAFAALPLDDAEPSEDARLAVEELALEVQRSLDFFDASFGRTPVATLWIAPGETEPDAVAPALERNIGVRVRGFDLSEHFAIGGALTHPMQAKLLLALGAAVLGQRADAAQDLLASLRPETQPRFRARQMASCAAALGAVLLGVYAIERSGLSRDASALAALETEQDGLKTQIAELSTRKKAGDDRTLASAISQLRTERDARTRELRALADDPVTEGRRFAGVLESLARHPVDGVWLRTIRIEGGGAALGLEGSSLAPDGVSNLLTSLEDEPNLAGVRFGALRAMRSEDDPDRVDFTLGDAAEGNPR